MQIPKNHNQKHIKPHYRSQSLYKSQSTKDPQQNLPLLLRQKTLMQQQSIQENNNIDGILGNIALPSCKFTKQQNIQIADELLDKISSLRNCKNSNTVKQLVRKRIKTQYTDADTSQISTQRLITDPGIVVQKQRRNEKQLIDKEQIEQNGVKYPYRLYVLNNKRKYLLQELLTNNNKESKENLDLNMIKQDLEVRLKAQIKLTQIEKSKKALGSKNHMNNALYSLLALNKQSQAAVKLKYREHLPKDSRFYMI